MTMLSVVTKLPLEPTGKSPVIFVHGGGTSSPVWTYWQAAFVQAGWPTHNLDLRGHGASGTVDLTRVGIFDYVDDVNAVAEQLDAPPVVVGWSMGGHIAVIAASRVVTPGVSRSTPIRRLIGWTSPSKWPMACGRQRRSARVCSHYEDWCYHW